MAILYITIILFILYSILIVYYWRAWLAIPEYRVRDNAKTQVSIVIPARNEENNIVPCLRSVCNQDYPVEAFQIIVVDDCSMDKTWELVSSFSDSRKEVLAVRLDEVDDLQFSAHKKRAIKEGIANSANELIVTTDADCNHPVEWIKTLASFYDVSKPAFIAAPVVFETNGSVLQTFQALDFMVLQGITAASVFKNILSMCNGANLAYERKAFDEVDGFEGIDNIASGDDMLLMYKIWKKNPSRVHYVKSRSAIVHTQPMKTWKQFINQRIRWASKARFYNDRRLFPVLLLVYLLNLSFLVMVVAAFWFPVLWLYLLAFWFAKTIVELPFVYSLANFFNRRSLLRHFFFFQPLHIGYTIIAGWLGQFGKYEWKGRQVK